MRFYLLHALFGQGSRMNFFLFFGLVGASSFSHFRWTQTSHAPAYTYNHLLYLNNNGLTLPPAGPAQMDTQATRNLVVDSEFVQELFLNLTPRSQTVIYSGEEEEKENCPMLRTRRVIRYETFGPETIYFDNEAFGSFLNELELSDPEDEQDPNLRREQSIVVVNASNGSGVFYSGVTDLAPEMFKAAADDEGRLKGLLQRKKHLLLSSEAKSQLATSVLKKLSTVHHREDIYELLELLVQCDLLRYCSGEGLVLAFSNLRATEIILKTDPTIFLESINVDDLVKFLEDEEYELLELLLSVGVDFSRQKKGRNVVDRLITMTVAKEERVSSEVPRKREKLLKRLQSLNVPLSITFENFESLLEVELFELALHVLEESDFGAQDEYGVGEAYKSPLSCALQSTNLEVIYAAMQKYLMYLNFDQLKEAYLTASLYCYEEVILIDRIADRMNSFVSVLMK